MSEADSLDGGTTDGRTERARKLRFERRGQILDAALTVFARKGFHAASVSDIVRAAQVARGTFYLYFPSKRELFEALVDSLMADLDRGIKRVDLSADAPAPLEQLESNVLWLLSLPKARPAMLQILLWEAVGLDEALDKKLDSFHQRMFALTQRSLELGIEMGLVRQCDTRLTARFLVGSVKEVLLSLLVREDLEGVELAGLVRELVAFTSKGILRPGV